jgi:6-phosphogluconolactonase (cycloisomerase 2 family)
MADSLVFISIKGEQRLATYRLDEENGKLTHLADTKTKGEPGNLTCDAGRGLLFVAMPSSPTQAIASYSFRTPGPMPSFSSASTQRQVS